MADKIFHTACRDAAAERLLARELPRLAEEVRGLSLPGTVALLLGGGYGRGEGGACGGRLSNDLDLFLLTDLPEGRYGELDAALASVSRAARSRIGIDVDFTIRGRARLAHDASRLMVQELLRGHVALFPSDFDLAAWSGIASVPACDVPAGEAARLVMNRGMGLLLAAERMDDAGTCAPDAVMFVRRNINKAVLGAGDARLIAEGRYAWSVRARAQALGDADYDAAVAWKFEPTPPDPADFPRLWRTAREALLGAAEQIETRCAASVSRRTPREFARWIRRRGTVGPVAEWGLDCTVRVMRRVVSFLGRQTAWPCALSDSLRRDWRVFN